MFPNLASLARLARGISEDLREPRKSCSIVVGRTRREEENLSKERKNEFDFVGAGFKRALFVPLVFIVAAIL